MATIVHQKDKRSGITYAYESVSYWDREKKQSRAKRTLIGRVDDRTGEIVPTDGRCRRKKEEATAVKPGPVPSVRTARLFCGATCLFDAIGREPGIAEDLKRCFPKTWRQILSVAYYARVLPATGQKRASTAALRSSRANWSRTERAQSTKHNTASTSTSPPRPRRM